MQTLLIILIILLMFHYWVDDVRCEGLLNIKWKFWLNYTFVFLPGAQVSHLIELIRNDTGLDWSRMRLIGFSLGAHVMGYAGRNLRRKGMPVPRISGRYFFKSKICIVKYYGIWKFMEMIMENSQEDKLREMDRIACSFGKVFNVCCCCCCYCFCCFVLFCFVLFFFLCEIQASSKELALCFLHFLIDYNY